MAQDSARMAPVNLSRIVMRLARNPGTEFADGDDHRGYTLTAPLTADGMFDETAWQAAKDRCTVRRFAPDDDVEEGRLAAAARPGSSTTTTRTSADDEPIHRLGQHRFAVGEYVSVTDEEGRLLTYKVTEVQKA
jgi:hypothetical protein